MIAKLIIGKKADLEARIVERGFVTAQEPTSGSGAMIVAFAHEMRELGINDLSAATISARSWEVTNGFARKCHPSLKTSIPSPDLRKCRIKGLRQQAGMVL